MLQFRRFDRQVEPPQVPHHQLALPEVAQLADQEIQRLRAERRARVAEGPALWRGMEWLDRQLRTETLERLDRDSVSDQRKLGIVEALHQLNVRLFSYRRFLSAIAPMVRRINEREGRPAQVVELAAGYGEFTLRAPALAQRMRLDLRITGTDIVPAYVARGAAEARRRGVDARFERLDALTMDVPPGRFDIAVIAQSMHHFSAGQLARMIAACRQKLSTGFVGVDGHRSLLLLWAVPTYALLFGAPARRDFAHDALLSGRKFFSESELERIGAVGAPGASVRVRTSHPGYSVLTVDFEGRP